MLSPRQQTTLRENIDARAAVFVVLRGEPLEATFEASMEVLLGVDGDFSQWVAAKSAPLRRLLATIHAQQPELRQVDQEQIARRRAQGNEWQERSAISDSTRYGVRSPEVERLEATRPPTDGSVVPALSDRRFSPVEDITPPLAARTLTTKHVEFHGTFLAFAERLRAPFWPIAIIDVEYVEGRTEFGALADPYARRDVIDMLPLLPDVTYTRDLLALVRDPHDQVSHMRLAELMETHSSVVGAISHPSYMPYAIAGISADRVYWAGIDDARVDRARTFIRQLEEPTARGRWARHLLVAAAAGQVGATAMTQVLPFSYAHVNNMSHEVGKLVCKAFPNLPSGQPAIAIAIAAQAMGVWVWTWARRHARLFEPGFLDDIRRQPFLGGGSVVNA